MMRTDHSLAIFKSQLIIFGGCYLNKAFNDVSLFATGFLFSRNNFCFRPLINAPPSPPGTNSFSAPKVSGEAPSPRWGHTAHVVGTKMYVIGGRDAKTMFNNVHVLDTATWEWSVLETANAVAPRSGHTSFVYQKKIWVFGGEGPGGMVSENVLVLDVEAGSWEEVERMDNMPCGRSGGVLSLVEKKNIAFLLGGEGGGDVVSISTLDLKDIQLKSVKTTAADFGGSAAASSPLPKKVAPPSSPAAAPAAAPSSPVPALTVTKKEEVTNSPVPSPRGGGSGEGDDRSSELARFFFFF